MAGYQPYYCSRPTVALQSETIHYRSLWSLPGPKVVSRAQVGPSQPHLVFGFPIRSRTLSCGPGPCVGKSRAFCGPFLVLVLRLHLHRSGGVAVCIFKGRRGNSRKSLLRPFPRRLYSQRVSASYSPSRKFEHLLEALPSSGCSRSLTFLLAGAAAHRGLRYILGPGWCWKS